MQLLVREWNAHLWKQYSLQIVSSVMWVNTPFLKSIMTVHERFDGTDLFNSKANVSNCLWLSNKANNETVAVG